MKPQTIPAYLTTGSTWKNISLAGFSGGIRETAADFFIIYVLALALN